ncbi:MAG: hypothetical protein LBK82_12415 [Planctomycetaceae bacterium]|nr:hypothetical protein [Planctomycetaceae bacterium]
MGNLLLKGCVGVSRLAPVNGWQFDSKTEGNTVCRVNLVHSRLSPTRPFSKRSPTSCKRSPTSFHLFSCVSCLKRTFQGLDT